VKEKAFSFSLPEAKESPVTLTPRQEEIFRSLSRLELPDYALIYGVTGSGKTEIFLSLIAHFIKKKSRSCTLSLR
jgi:primosomal protein N'